MKKIGSKSAQIRFKNSVKFGQEFGQIRSQTVQAPMKMLTSGSPTVIRRHRPVSEGKHLAGNNFTTNFLYKLYAVEHLQNQEVYIGLTKEEAFSTVRISFGKIHTLKDVETVANAIHQILIQQSEEFMAYEG